MNMAKKRTEEPQSDRIRQIGAPRIETIIEALSPMQVDECKTKITRLLDEQDDLKSRLKAAAKSAKDALGHIKAQLDTARTEVATGKRRLDIEVGEFLTSKNEVIRVRSDTGEQIGARTARPAELQEPLPLDEVEEEGEEDSGFDA